MPDADVLILADYVSRREGGGHDRPVTDLLLMRRLHAFNDVIAHWCERERSARARVAQFEDERQRFLDSLSR